MNLLSEYRDYVLLGLVIFSLCLVVVLIVHQIRLNKLRKRIEAMLGDTGAANLEDAITELQRRTALMTEKTDQSSQEIQAILKQMKHMKANVAIIRYNAFNETGSDLSFSAAIVDAYGNGMVLTGIHTRHDTQMYAKPLDKGHSTYTLSPEEKEAVTRALQA